MTQTQEKRLVELEGREQMRRDAARRCLAKKKVAQEFHREHFEETASKELRGELNTAIGAIA